MRLLAVDDDLASGNVALADSRVHIFAYSADALLDTTGVQLEVARVSNVFSPQAFNIPIGPASDRLNLGRVHVGPAPVQIDLEVPTGAEPAALDLLSRLPARPVARILAALRDWLANHPSVTRVSIRSITEPDAPGWTEVVFELKVEAETDEALAMWGSLASRVDEAKRDLTGIEVEALNRHLAVHLVWPEEEADDLAIQSA